MKKLLALALILLSFTLVSCTVAPQNSDVETEIVDLLGRTVSVPEKIERVACIGSGALRLYSYIGDMTKLCGVESCEYGYLISARPYQLLNAELFASLPSIGAGGPSGTPDAEALVQAAPDVIFSLYTQDVGAMDELQAKTGIPVVVLSYGETEAFDADLLTSVTLMGQILNREERAAEVVEYITELTADLDRRTRTRDIPDADKKTVYLGCHTNYGTHGIGSSTANYSLFNAVHALNVLDINGYHGYQKALDLETIITMNPDVIIIDAAGIDLLREEYAENPAAFALLKAFRNDEVYVQMPYNAYFTNLEIAYADAYYIGKVLYPDAFADVDLATKFDEISIALLGAPCYEQLAATLPAFERFDAE